VDASLPVLYEDTPATSWLREKFQGVEDAKWTCESDMYHPILSVLRDYLSWKGSSALAVPTHTRGSFHADLTTSLYEDPARVLYGLYYFIELKFGNGRLDSSENCGQVVDYFHQARKVQPYRTHFVAILSNFKEAWVFLIKYERDGFRIVKRPANSLADAIVYAEDRSSEQLTARVPELDSCIHDKSTGYQFLGTSRHSFVLSLPTPSPSMTVQSRTKPNTWRPPSRFSGAKSFALKIKHSGNRRNDIIGEVKVLSQLRNADSKHIPELVWSPRSRPELGIVPVGRPIDFRQSADTSREIVEGVIEGLRYLHQQGIVHRDIRPSNLVLDDSNNLVIIDFETALSISEKEVEFFGGFTCWPKRVLESDVEIYVPCKSDDLRAAILVVLHLLFPSRFDSFYVSNIRPGKRSERTNETRLLLMLWGDIEKSSIWSRFVLAADREDYEELRKMSEVFCHI